MRQQRRPSRFLWVFVVVFIVLFLVILLSALSPRVRRLSLRRDLPQPVYDRVVHALERNSALGLHQDLSPSLRELFDYNALLQGEQELSSTQGQIVLAEVLVPVTVKNDPPWNGEWAEGQVRVQRGGGPPQTYLVRLHKEGRDWWLFGTLLIEP